MSCLSFYRNQINIETSSIFSVDFFNNKNKKINKTLLINIIYIFYHLNLVRTIYDYEINKKNKLIYSQYVDRLINYLMEKEVLCYENGLLKISDNYKNENFLLLLHSVQIKNKINFYLKLDCILNEIINLNDEEILRFSKYLMVFYDTRVPVDIKKFNDFEEEELVKYKNLIDKLVSNVLNIDVTKFIEPTKIILIEKSENKIKKFYKNIKNKLIFFWNKLKVFSK